MASESAIAEGGSIVTADQINYEQKLFSHPSYRMEPQYPNTFGQTISLGTSQTPVVINIPPEVFNLSQSYINYTVTLPASAAFTWYARQALAEISHVQFYSGNSQWICDLDNLNNYLDITLKKELSQEDFLSLDLSLNNIGASNVQLNAIPALRNSNMTTGNVDNGPGFSSSINYLEPAYFSVSPNATAVTYNVQFNLGKIKNTVFSIDKNLYFGQTMYLKLYFGPVSKVAYASTGANQPSDGVKSAYLGAATIANLVLQLAVESNQSMRAMIINKVSTVGQEYIIPYVQAFKNSNSTGSQNISLQLDQGNGRTLVKVYHAPYNSQEQFDTMYDHCNCNNAPPVAGVTPPQKVQVYYTQLNGKRNQDININCTSTAANGPFLDYMSHRRQLRGSILMNANIYQQNWFHCDDFSDEGPKYDQKSGSELISGIPMNISPLTWSFVGVTMANLAFQHYTWCVFTKKLIMQPGQVSVQ